MLIVLVFVVCFMSCGVLSVILEDRNGSKSSGFIVFLSLEIF